MDIARVVILNKYADLDRPLDYLIPPETVAPIGSWVKVPLGKRVVEGVVVEKPATAAVTELRELAGVIALLPRELVKLAAWLEVRAGCSMAAVLGAMLPPGGGKPLKRWQVDERAAAAAQGLTEKQQLVVEFLSRQCPMLKAEISRALGISVIPINRLISRKILVPADTPVLAKPWPLEPVAALTPDQTRVIAAVEAETNCFQKSREFLLHGVTGSGKTEVYLRLVRRVITLGRQALILVPEIALTAQVVARFRAAFAERVVVLHSGLSNSVRAADWENISRGQFQIVIGTRSAVFAPLNNLGLIVVDEEHEPAYKQEEVPRYHARDVALFRARWHRAAVVLASATPALESCVRAEAGRYFFLEMPNRIHQNNGITADLVDMRLELQQGNREMLSRELLGALKNTLENKEQALLFLNRRGVAPTVLCRSCGFRYTCSNCSTALTLHRRGLLKCHHCGATAAVAAACPQCGSKYLRELGLGTQKLEARLAELFPDTAICRLDRDSAASAADKEQQLFRFYQQESGILLGTQMIAKGLDFPKVTLVGIVLADLSLGMSDFRAAERTFQLVTQAAGRTGRADKPGRVIIQTYQPEHYSLKYAVNGDFWGFYRQEMRMRAAGGMPPFSALTRIVVSSEQRQRLLNQVELINPFLASDFFELLYSGPPPLEKLKRRYRWQFLLRHTGSSAAWREIDSLRRKLSADRYCRIVFDNNPYNFM